MFLGELEEIEILILHTDLEHDVVMVTMDLQEDRRAETMTEETENNAAVTI
jgi:hypothetical protein